VIDPLVYLTLVVKCITTTGKWGCARLADMDATADRRDTAIVLRNGSRSRSMAVSQRYERIDDEEAEECANKVMDWLMADETTELLGCSSSPFRRR
jgi:hypothetical protein